MATRDVLARLTFVRPAGEGRWMARCPAHEDKTASLSVRDEAGKVLLHCHANCATDAVVAAMGLAMRDLAAPGQPGGAERKIEATYDYQDRSGKLLYQAVRYQPKEFRQRQPDGSGGWNWSMTGIARVPYRLPSLLAADPAAPVFVCEGEKDADNLARLGLVATTNVGGAGKWSADYSETLRGRTVVILPDNDPPGEQHARAVQTALTGVAASAQIIRLPGLPPKGDVSDWLGRGGTAAQLTAMCTRPQVFEPAADRIRGERAERINDGARALQFGIKFLDDAMGGILPNDVVLIGAKTGAGKSQISALIALNNCTAGRRVHYFALEAEAREIERRLKYQIIARHHYANSFTRPAIHYQDWRLGRLDEQLGGYEAGADLELASLTRGLFTFYRLESFTSDDFHAQVEAVKNDTDLIILDHLHYVDSDDENENRGYKKTLKQIRDCALRIGKPIIIVAHVRKGDRRYEGLIPGIEDFHGSSDIPKIATKAIMLAPAYDKPSPDKSKWPTYMQVAKCRTNGSLPRYAAIVSFDIKTDSYDNEYGLGRLTEGGKKFEYLAFDEMPHWSRAVAPTVGDDD